MVAHSREVYVDRVWISGYRFFAARWQRNSFQEAFLRCDFRYLAMGPGYHKFAFTYPYSLVDTPQS